MKNETKDFLTNDSEEINIGAEELVLAPDEEIYAEAAQIAAASAQDVKYPFVIKYDINWKEFLLDMIDKCGGVVKEKIGDTELAVSVNMTQLKFIKALDCVEKVSEYEDEFLALMRKEKNVIIQNAQTMTLTADEPVAMSAVEATGVAEASVACESPSSSCCCPSNNTMETAREIQLEQFVSGQICCPGAEQWFKVTAPETQKYTIFTTGSLDTEGELSGCCLSESITNDDCAGRVNFRIVETLCAGYEYYIKVNAKNNATGSYTLKVTAQSLAEEVLIHSNRTDEIVVLEQGKTYELPRGEGYGFLNVANTENAPLSVEVNPNSTTDKRVYWYASSIPSDPVDTGFDWYDNTTKYQTITANSCGGTKLYAYDWFERGKTGTVYVAVVPNGGSLVKATGISLDHTSLSLDIGEYQKIIASVSPSSATVQDVEWVSDNPNIATVTPYGRVKAIAPGTTKIHAKSMTGTPVVEAVCIVTVKGFYNIVNVETGKVANISGSYLVNLSDGKNITLYSKSGSNEQVWKIDKISDSEDCYIRSYIDQEYGFNAYRSSSGNYNCNIHEIIGNETDAAVHFVLQDDGSYKIKLANYSNYYLTAITSNDGSDIRWQPENSEKNQHWKLEVADFTEREVIATEVINNIQNCSTNLIPSNRKTASVAVAQAMLNIGYPVSFVAGMLANIVFEGSTGQFESSNYVSHPENKPDYLVYMDTEYNGTNYYLNNFSGKTIMDVDVGVDSTYNMLCELAEQSNNTWYIDGSRVGFGLGCIQWSFARTLNLVNAYREINNNSNSITTEQACQGEALLMLRELGSSEYNSIISSWKAANASLNSSSAASSAGSYLCNNYIRPKDDTGSVASTRATRAAAIYSAIAI